MTELLPATATLLPFSDRRFESPRHPVRAIGSIAVLAIALPTPPPMESSGPDRKPPDRLRRVEHALEADFGSETRIHWGIREATALIPVADSSDAHIGRMVSVIAENMQDTFAATITFAACDQLPTAVTHADELLEIVLRLGLRPGLYRFQDLALEYQLTRPGPARDRLAAEIAQLNSRSKLRETLRSYIASNGSRGCTARSLKVHPNTVDYRLSQITRLTGSNPVHPEGMWRLRSALLVHTFLETRPVAGADSVGYHDSTGRG
ncbi:PucR family transcriptional regulator [Nocardia aurea]|uniref:PucR family transcriptional regulator n=1 Tax=Nocardia aurea TaxID=2144174 RepID=UPI00130083C6|nr:helix-turn-helix domain-containing protein [Nocardia aurea]